MAPLIKANFLARFLLQRTKSSSHVLYIKLRPNAVLPPCNNNTSRSFDLYTRLLSLPISALLIAFTKRAQSCNFTIRIRLYNIRFVYESRSHLMYKIMHARAKEYRKKAQQRRSSGASAREREERDREAIGRDARNY